MRILKYFSKNSVHSPKNLKKRKKRPKTCKKPTKNAQKLGDYTLKNTPKIVNINCDFTILCRK